MNEGAKETVLSHFTYGLYAVTVKREGDEHGITANWVSQASFDPPMVVVAVESRSKIIELIRDAHHFAINVFHEGQRDLAEKLGRGQRHVGGNHDFFVHLALDGLDLGLGSYAVRDEPFGKQGETIVAGLLFPLLGRLVQDFIVREGMRVGPGHVRVHQGGALTLAHVFRGP